MNVHNSELHRQHEAAMARKARLWNTPPVAKERQTNAAIIPFMAPQIPLWRQEPIQFDAHVQEFRAMRLDLLNMATNPCRAHIRKRCIEMGITFAEITGPSRRRELTIRRHFLMWEIKRIVKPSMPYPELGRLFGGRDHTAVYYAVEKMRAALEGEKSSIKKMLKKRKRSVPQKQWMADVFQVLDGFLKQESSQ